MDAYVYLPYELSTGFRKIAISEILQYTGMGQKIHFRAERCQKYRDYTKKNIFP